MIILRSVCIALVAMAFICLPMLIETITNESLGILCLILVTLVFICILWIAVGGVVELITGGCNEW